MVICTACKAVPALLRASVGGRPHVVSDSVPRMRRLRVAECRVPDVAHVLAFTVPVRVAFRRASASASTVCSSPPVLDGALH